MRIIAMRQSVELLIFAKFLAQPGSAVRLVPKTGRLENEPGGVQNYRQNFSLGNVAQVNMLIFRRKTSNFKNVGV